MSTDARAGTAAPTLPALELSAGWATFWVAVLRVVTGYWFLHAGLTKYANLWYGGADPFGAGWWLTGATRGTLVHPVTAWFGANAPWLVNYAIPAGELLIGLGLLLGALTRVAAASGAVLMTFFYLGNAEWTHGLVNGNLLGLLLFVTLIVFGAGRAYGLDARIEDTTLVRRHPWLRYCLG